MWYVPSLALVVAGLIGLGILVLRLRRVLHTLHQTTSMVATNTQDRAGLIRARTAALQVAFRQRRRTGENQ